MVYIKQRLHNDCMVCCLAMFCDKSYEEIIKFFPKLQEEKNSGLSALQAMEVLDTLKVPYCFYGFLDWKEYLRQPIVLNNLKDAIFSFPSFCLDGSRPKNPIGRHAVIWNSEKRVFWCPASPPLTFIKSFFKKNEDTKAYYNTLKNVATTEVFCLIERK